MIRNFSSLIVFLMIAVLTGCGFLTNSDVSLISMTIQGNKTSLEISVPFELRDDTVNGMQDMDAYLDKFIVKANENKDLMITACCYVYNKEKIEATTGQPFALSLEDGLLGGVANMQNVTKNVVTYSEVADVTINNIHGKEITGSVDVPFFGKTKTTKCDFRMMNFGEGVEMWTILIIHKPDDETQRISDAVFNSLKLS